MIKNKFKIRGEFKIQRYHNKLKKILDTEIVTNLIVDSGLQRVSELLNGGSTNFYEVIGIGEGTNSPANGDITLQNESVRETAITSNDTPSTANYSNTFTFGSGISLAITEAGIFDGLTVSGSSMLNRVTFGVKNVDTNIDLIVTATITVQRV